MRREFLAIITAVIAIIGLYTPAAAGGWNMKSEFGEHWNLDSAVRNGTFTSLDQCSETLGHWNCRDAWWKWQSELGRERFRERERDWRQKARKAWWERQGEFGRERFRE